jgi:cell division protein FtsL
MSYFQGNLALKQEPVMNRQTRQTTRTVQTTKTLPKKEKMLYLVSLAVCGLIASLVILNNAVVYQTNLDLQQSKQAIKELNQANAILQVQIRSLHEPKRLQEMGKMLGYSTQGADQTQLVQSGSVQVAGQNSSVAVNVR